MVARYIFDAVILNYMATQEVIALWTTIRPVHAAGKVKSGLRCKSMATVANRRPQAPGSSWGLTNITTGDRKKLTGTKKKAIKHELEGPVENLSAAVYFAYGGWRLNDCFQARLGLMFFRRIRHCKFLQCAARHIMPHNCRFGSWMRAFHAIKRSILIKHN